MPGGACAGRMSHCISLLDDGSALVNRGSITQVRARCKAQIGRTMMGWGAAEDLEIRASASRTRWDHTCRREAPDQGLVSGSVQVKDDYPAFATGSGALLDGEGEVEGLGAGPGILAMKTLGVDDDELVAGHLEDEVELPATPGIGTLALDCRLHIHRHRIRAPLLRQGGIIRDGALPLDEVGRRRRGDGPGYGADCNGLKSDSLGRADEDLDLELPGKPLAAAGRWGEGRSRGGADCGRRRGGLLGL